VIGFLAIGRQAKSALKNLQINGVPSPRKAAGQIIQKFLAYFEIHR
jgi:hypothetical protein